MRMDRNHSEIEIDGELLKINENYDQNLPNGMFDPENFEPTRVCLFDERLIVWQPGLLNDSRVFMIGPGQVLFKIVDLSSKEEITHLSDDYLQNVHIRVVDDFIGKLAFRTLYYASRLKTLQDRLKLSDREISRKIKLILQ